jgi:hypothetical protein
MAIFKSSKIYTKDGIFHISDVEVGELVWDGEDWTELTKKEEVFLPSLIISTENGHLVSDRDQKILSNGRRVYARKTEYVDLYLSPKEHEEFKGSSYTSVKKSKICNTLESNERIMYKVKTKSGKLWTYWVCVSTK